LREEAGDIGRRTDEAAGRRDRVGRIITGNDKAPAYRQPRRVATGKRDTLADGHIGHRLTQTNCIDDLTLDPVAIGLPGDCFDRETE
jgi:hypothetical protein